MPFKHRAKLVFFIGVLLFAALVAVALRFALRPSEPSYHGITLSVLLEHYNGPDRNPEAKEALRALGSNALPTLMTMLKAKDSAFKLQSREWAQRLHLIKNVRRESAWFVNWSAAFAFTDVGQDGTAALPELIKIYDRHISESSQGATAFALGCLGLAASNAIPHLVRGMKVATGPARANTLIALSYISPETTETTFINFLRDKDPMVRVGVALGLGKCHTKEALDGLLSLQNDQDTNVRENARNALRLLGKSGQENSALPTVYE